MRGFRAVAAAVAVLMVCVSALAQEKPGNAAMVYSVKAKSGSWGQLEEAMKKHFAWHRSQSDTFAYHVWQVMSGDDVGDLVVGTFGHHWREFGGRDELDRADVADFVANVMPLTEKMSLHYVSMIPEASRPSARTQPPAMSQVTHYFVKPSGVVQFADAIKAVKAALDKVNYPVYSRWYSLVSGGEGPHYVLVVERNEWAEFEPMAKTLEQVIAEATSPSKAVELMSAVRDNTRHTYSELLVYRPDLSYLPAN
jgi:hypothetical protein